MEYQKYEKKLIEELKQMDPSAGVTINPVLRNNGVEQNALLIVHQGETCVPNIYVSSLYDHFCRNNLSVRQSAKYTLQLYREIMSTLDQDCLLEKELTDFEKMKKHLTIRMVNREKNRKLLEEVVSIPE